MKKKNYFMILLVVLVLSIINLTGCSKERASNKDSYESLKEKGSIVMVLMILLLLWDLGMIRESWWALMWI